MNIPFIDDCLNKGFLADMHDGDVVLMENLRFYVGEEKNDDEFARDLSRGFDLYVNDAFAVSHRASASIVGITKYLPSYAGDLMIREIENISKCLTKQRKTAGNFYWTNEQELPKITKPKIYQYDLNGKLIQIFNTKKEAADLLHLDDGSIAKVCKGKRKTCGGFIWKEIYENNEV